MTRKEELEARADLLSRQLGSGHGGKPIILKALQHLEREVLSRLDAYMDNADSMNNIRDWVWSQQKELG